MKSKRRSPKTAKPRAAPSAASVKPPFYSSIATEDLAYWRKNNPKLAVRIETLVAEIQRSPFTGIGKPEPMRHEWQGFWSRRINETHRLVYRVENERIYIAQCRYHYNR
jgi:toxin YoeB